MLSELMQALGIEERVEDVTDVTFSNPELLRVERAGKGATVRRLAASMAGAEDGSDAAADADGADAGATFQNVPLPEGEDFEPVPDPVQTVPVAEGDWILTSLKSFESEETLTIKTARAVYEVRVTDPIAGSGMYNPWGPGFGFFGGTNTWDIATLANTKDIWGNVEATLDVSYDDKREYAAGDEIEFNFAYLIKQTGWMSFPNNYNPWMGYPTFTYDISGLLKSDAFEDTIKGTKSYLNFGGKKRGTIEVTKDGKIIIQITDTNWFNTRDEIGGTLSVKLKLVSTDSAQNGNIEVNFPGVTVTPVIKTKVNITADKKKVTLAPGSGPENGYTLQYEAKVHAPAGLTSLVFDDTLGGKQTLAQGTLKYRKDNGQDNQLSSTPKTTGNGFTCTIPTGGQAGDYTITYSTTVSADDYKAMAAGGSSWETNTCKWVYNGNNELPGGDTSYEIKKESPPKPTVTKASTAGNSVKPGDTITYTLTIEGKNLAGMNVFDNMTDLQNVVGNPTVSVKVGDNNDSAAASALGNVLSYNSDGSYSSNTTSAIKAIIPDGSPFNDESTTKTITITYTTKVIDQATATANGVYGDQTINNTVSENWSWQQKTTTTKVSYEKQPVTKVSKTESHTDSDGKLANGGTITYTITIGDGTTTLDGVKVKDYASGDQKINNDFQVTGSNVSITSLGSQLSTSPQNWDQTVLDFTFPPGTGKGPVTITYTASPYDSETDKDALASANIYGERTFTNKVSTGTDEGTTGVKYEYPEKPEDPVAKTSSSTTISGGDNDTKLDPEETVDYTVYFGKNEQSLAGLSVMDQMTDLQKLKTKNGDNYVASTVHVELGTATYGGAGTPASPYTAPTNFAKGATTAYGKVGNTTIMFEGGVLKYKSGDKWVEGMPLASHGWADDGVTWSHFDDGSYSDNLVRVFNFKFPQLYDSEANIGKDDHKVDVQGVVKVTYTTTVITKDEATASKVMGDKTLRNTATLNQTNKSTEDPATFPKNLNHNPDVSKQFNGWDDDGYTTWWTIDVKADAESSYPLNKLTLTEDWANGSIYYTTDWPVQNYKKNVLADIDLLGAEIVTDSGKTLQPGRDYTIDKEKGSFYFEKLEEPVSIRLPIHNPDATINTFYQHNQVTLTWQKDEYNTGSKTVDATGRRVKQEVDLTKSGKYEEVGDKHIITWTVIFNPYFKDVVPEMSPIQFTDTIPDGLQLTGDIKVKIQGGTWTDYTLSKSSNYDGKVTQTPGANGEGTVVTIANIDPQNNYGNPISRDMYYWVAAGGAWDTLNSADEYTTHKGESTEYKAESDGHNGEIVKDKDGNVVGRWVHDVGLGLSKNSYTVTYQTEVTTDEYNSITSSLTGKRTYKNDVNIGNGKDQNFTASNKVTVEGDHYLKKYDVTREDDEGYIIDMEDMHDNAISYEVEINPKKHMVNNGKALTLTDRIDTIMELDTDSVLVYAVGDDGTRSQLSHAQLAAQGIAISYNDDTRILSVSGLADQTSYVVAYKAVSRAVGTSTFTNTATLVGGGSHSDKVSDQHAITNDDASFWGNRHPKLELKKIDENDITNKLDGATFSLYRVKLKNSAETDTWTRAQWMDLLAKVDSDDEAVRQEAAKGFEFDHEELIASGLTTGANGDPGSLILEYDQYQDGKGVTGNYLKEHMIYYWKEDTPPSGFHATDNDKHYFVVYVDGELDADYTQEDQRKKAAWALDDAASLANGWTVASMSADTEWKVNNTRNGYTSITATKRWEGDYNNQYETRPEDGILYDLYRVDKTTGQQTLVEELSPVPINDDGSGNWSSYTWYRLDSSYDYTVRERAVPGYITTYSDEGKGVEGGKITVTNTYVPKSTDVYVQKKWDPEGGAKPAQVKVSLYRILHTINEDGSTTVEEPEYMGDDYTYMLTEANGWKYGWEGLDTSDPNGNTITYTVVEDVAGVNADATVSASGTKYGATYSDGGQGTVDAPKENPLVITNMANAPGSLKITKKVTVNGKPVSDTAADGVYRFRLTKINKTKADDPTTWTEVPAYYMHDHKAENCTNHDSHLVGDVTVKVENGVASSTMVDNLDEGSYYVYEYAPDGGTELAYAIAPDGQRVEQSRRVEVQVTAGVTAEDDAPQVTFVNDLSKDRVEVTKKWQSANEGVSSWPEGMEVQVQLKVRDENGALSGVPTDWGGSVAKPDGWSDTQWLTNNRQSYVWDALPELETGKSYVVVETGIRQRVDEPSDKTGETNSSVQGYTKYYPNANVYSIVETVDNKTVTTYYRLGTATPPTTTLTEGDVTVTSGTANVTANGTTSSYNVEGQRTNAKNENGTENTSKGVEYTLTNKQVTTVPFQKQWGMDGKDAWPSEVQSITVQLYQDGTAMAGKIVELTTTDTTDARGVSPTLGGGGYNYTFTGLEKGHAYTVKETKVKLTNSNEYDLTDSSSSSTCPYVAQQVNGTTVRNIPTKTNLEVKKMWLDEEGHELSSNTWPQYNSAGITITGKLTRERREHGKTLEIDWVPDTTYNGPDNTFTINGTNGASITVDEYGYGGTTLYEYRYTATEISVTAGSATLTNDFTPSFSRNGFTLTLTNALNPTEVSFQKKWQKADGSEDNTWPQENGSPVGVEFKVRRSTDNGANWTDYATQTVTSGEKITVYDLPKYGFNEGSLIEYTYSVVEESAPAGYVQVNSDGAVQASFDSRVTGTGTLGDPYVITNKPETTSVTVTKAWQDLEGNPVNTWPSTIASVDATLRRERREYDDAEGTWEQDPAYGKPVQLTSSTIPVTVENLPTSGYDGGKHYAYRYTIAEDKVKGYHEGKSSYEDGEKPISYAITLTNKKDDTDMDVSVKKKWVDADGKELSDQEAANANLSAEFELHKIRYAKLTTHIQDTNDGPVVLSITKNGGTPTTIELSTTPSANDAYTYTAGTGWTYVYEPLEKGATYQVSATANNNPINVSSTGTQNVNGAGTATGSFTSTDNTDHEVTFGSSSSNTRTITVTYQEPGSYDENDGRWLTVNLCDANGSYLNKTVTLNHSKWTDSVTFTGLNEGTTYTVKAGNFDHRYYDSVSVSTDPDAAGSESVTCASTQDTVYVKTVAIAEPKLTVKEVTLTPWGQGDAGSIPITVTQGGQAVSGMPFNLDKGNGWAYYKNLDGSSQYQVMAGTPSSEFSRVSILNGGGTFTGNANHVVELAAVKADANTLTVTASGATSGEITYLVKKGNDSITTNPIVLNSSNNWTQVIGLDGDGSSNYTVYAITPDGTTITSATIDTVTNATDNNNQTVSFTGNANNPTINISASTGSSSSGGTMPVTIHWPSSTQSQAHVGYHSCGEAEINNDNTITWKNNNTSANSSGDLYYGTNTQLNWVTTGTEYIYVQLNNVYGTENAISSIYIKSNSDRKVYKCIQDSTTYGDWNIHAVEITQSDLLAVTEALLLPVDATSIEISFDGTFPTNGTTGNLGNRLPIPFWLPKVALAETSDSTTIAMVDETVDTQTVSGDDYTYKWETLDKKDDQGQPIRYYVKEVKVSQNGTDVTSKYTTTYDKGFNGTNYIYDTALGSTGEITVTNTDNTKAQVKVRKVFKDATGKTLGEDDVADENPTFTLKRYKTEATLEPVQRVEDITVELVDKNESTIASGQFAVGDTVSLVYSFNNSYEGSNILRYCIATSWSQTTFSWDNSDLVSHGIAAHISNNSTANPLQFTITQDLPYMTDETTPRKIIRIQASEITSNALDGNTQWNLLSQNTQTNTNTETSLDNDYNSLTLRLSDGAWHTDEDGAYWEGTFPSVALSDNGTTFTYYVEESGADDYDVSYSVGGEDVAPGEGGLSNANKWLKQSGTVTVTNTATEAKVKVRKQFTDNAGNPLTVADALNNAGTDPGFTLKRYRRHATTTPNYDTTIYIKAKPTNGASDFETYGTPLQCNVGDVISLSWTQKSGYTGHVISFYGSSDMSSGTTRIAAGGNNGYTDTNDNNKWVITNYFDQYDWNTDQNIVEMRVRVEADGLVEIPNPDYNGLGGQDEIRIAASGSTRELYCDHPVTYDDQSGNAGIQEKTNGITMAVAQQSASGGSTTTTYSTTSDSWAGETFSLSRTNPTNNGWALDTDGGWWVEKTFDNLDLVDTATGDTFIYYVEETAMPSGYTVSYTVNGETVNPNDTDTGDAEKWLASSGTMVVTNKDQRRTSVTATKEWRDGDVDKMADHQDAGHTVTLELYRVADEPNLSTDSHSGLVMPTGSLGTDYVLVDSTMMPSGLKNPVVLNSDDATHGAGAGVWSYTWSGLPTTDGSHGDNYYKYYVKEVSTTATNTRPRYSEYKYPGETSATGVASVKVTNEETSVAVSKKWMNGETDTTDKHTNDSVTVALYRVATVRGSSPEMPSIITEDELVLPDGLNKTESINSNGNLVETQTLSNTNNWTYTWTGLPVGDATYDYTYYVEETSPTGTNAAYEYDFVTDGAAASGVKSATITNHETSVTVQKKWRDEATGANTVSAHASTPVEVALYYATGTPTVSEGDGGLVLPGTKEQVSAELVPSIKNPVTLNSSDATSGAGSGKWTYTWDNLPVQDADGHDLYYYVEEVAKVGDGYKTAYAYDFNTAESTSGVEKAVITNYETSVSVTKDWVSKNITSGNEEKTNLAHRGQTVTLELWRALKERGASSYNVGVAENGITHLAFPEDGGNTFSSYERVGEPVVVQFDMGGLNWNKKWTGLPLVVTKDGKTYDVVYFVRESANSEGTVSATYDTMYVDNNAAIEADKLASGVRSVAITNHETSVSATKTWNGGGHTDATVTLDLWKAVKAPEGSTGTWNVVEDGTSGNAFPVEVASGGAYVAAARVDRKTVSYGTAEGHSDVWFAEWDHLPTHEDFQGQTYELRYFVREAHTAEGGVTYPASATYVPTYNDDSNNDGINDKDSGVKSVAITNDYTSVKATKAWVDQSGTPTSESHQLNDKVTYELWKAHEHDGGAYGASAADALSGLQFPTKVNENGKFDAPELVETQTVAYNSTNGWQYEWNPLPLYETVDGVTYKLAYFVREKSVFTDGEEHSPSPTYAYKDGNNSNELSSTTIATNGVNGGTVNVTNHETSVEVEKKWTNFGTNGESDYADATATVQLYKARKSLDTTDKNYAVNYNAAVGTLVFPYEASGSGTLASYEPFGEPLILKRDTQDSTKSWKGAWTNLPLYEVDPVSSKTYALEYYVQETATNKSGITTTYNYTFYDASDHSKGIQKVEVTNKKDDVWSVKVNKHWTGGNAGHQGVTMTLKRYGISTSDNQKHEDGSFSETIVLSDSNNWEHTWTGLPVSVNINGTTYEVDDKGHTKTNVLVYEVEEKLTDDNNDQRKDFEIERDQQTNELVWPSYQTGTNVDDKITYWDVSNKPKYYGRLKIAKDFAGIETEGLSSEQQTALENEKKKLQFEISTVDSALVDVKREYKVKEGDPAVDVIKIADEQELVRTTWYLMREKSSSKLVWVQEPVKNYGNGVRKTKEITVNDQTVNVTDDETDAEYQQRLKDWETAFTRDYNYINYADFTGEGNTFQILDSATHTGELGHELVMDKVYSVREVNAEGLISNYTLVSDQSTTTASEPVPRESVETVQLTNTYAPVKGTLRVTKNVTLNDEQKYDDVAAGQTFKIGLEELSGNDWVPVMHDVTSTWTERLPNGTTTTITETKEERWVESLTIGKGSTATAVFEGLKVPGVYRVYEMADDSIGNQLYSQNENATDKTPEYTVNGYHWQVSETGTYYVLTEDDPNTTENEYKLQMVDDKGTHTNIKGEWSEDTGYKVSITGLDGYDATGVTADSGVKLTAGTEAEKSPRNASIVLTNNKSETGSITVNKNLYYNGSPDTTKGGKTVCFGLYTGTPPTDANAVKETISGDGVNMRRFVTLGKDEHGNTTHKVTKVMEGEETEVNEPYSASWGAVTFSDLPYKDGSGKDITYYVYEMENTGSVESPNWQPVTDKNASLDFGDGTKTYTVIGDDKAVTLDHENREQKVTYTNSLKEQGKIKVTKQVLASEETGAGLDTAAQGQKFSVGLFKQVVDDHGTSGTSDDTVSFDLVPGRTAEVAIGNNGSGDVTFDKLDFEPGDSGTTYYVFEVDEKNNPVGHGTEVAGYKVTYAGDAISSMTGDARAGQEFTLTMANHDYDGTTLERNADGTAKSGATALQGATVNNVSSKSEFRIVKVDRQSWVEASDKATAKKLAGAKFTIRQLEDRAPVNGDPVMKPGIDPAESSATGADGVVSFPDVTNGYYEVKETASPTGYLVVGNSTFYLKVVGGRVVFIAKGEGAPSTWTEIRPDTYSVADGNNVMSYAPAKPAVEADSGSGVEAQAAVPATVTVGNVAGPELPSTGGPGLWPLMAAGAALLLASAATLALDRRRG